MAKKQFVCNSASLALPNEVNSFENNRFVMATGKSSFKLNIIKGSFSESSKPTRAGIVYVQSLVVEVIIDNSNLQKYHSVVLLELSLSNVGNVILGNKDNPVRITKVNNSTSGAKITFERYTHISQF